MKNPSGLMPWGIFFLRNTSPVDRFAIPGPQGSTIFGRSLRDDCQQLLCYKCGCK